MEKDSSQKISWLNTKWPDHWSQNKKALASIGVIISFFVVVFMFVSFVDSDTSNKVPTQVSELEKQEAQKELDELVALGKKANLIVSYEFSDLDSVVYIGPTWYSQTVQFKKDFIAKFGMLKEKIRGFSHFEVRDAYSNEKVGELTSFSKSIEIYK